MSKASIAHQGQSHASGFKSPRIPAKSSKTLSIAKAAALTEQIGLVFSEIEDPRVARTRALLIDIVIIGILSVIAGYPSA